MVDYESLRRVFGEMHHTAAVAPRLFRAPGRVNLIGEHTDYNDGYVLPMAIDRETVVAGRVRDDNRVRARSLDADVTCEFELDALTGKGKGFWGDYVEGVAYALVRRDVPLRGADLLIKSDVPVGAGLSSSAALEISVGLAFASLAGAGDFNRVQLALCGQTAEHVYVGTKSGIMDQFISALGRQGNALLIDCRSLQATPVPLDLDDTIIAICDTNVKHKLAASAYNTRRAECEQAVELLRQHLTGIRALRDVRLPDFEQYQNFLPEVIRRRCRHVITENGRTLSAVEAMGANNAEGLGRLMESSHLSLRDDYEVSSRELDVMVEIAMSIEGVTGARMTGGGFGGCTVNLVRHEAFDEFRCRITDGYRAATGLTPTIYISGASDGASEVY
jgi:galactokinase